MKQMVYYEIKKVFSKASSKIALFLLAIVLVWVCYGAIHAVYYVDGNGDTHTGIVAARRLRAEKKKWKGPLDEEKIRAVIEENRRVNETPEAQSEDVQKQNIAYGWKQGLNEIRDLLVNAYGDFREYDYYRADSLTADDAKDFYSNRPKQLKEWLDAEGAEMFSENEKSFLIKQYEELETPWEYDSVQGWTSMLDWSPSILMILTLVVGFLVSGIFSGEIQSKADSIYFSSFYGRNKAITAKIKAGFLIITGIYWPMMLLYTAVVLGALGADGAGCIIQLEMWKSFYHLTFFQEYLLILIGGYIGNLFTLLLTMLVSAWTKSTVLAVTIPFLIIFIPSFLQSGTISLAEKILGLLPDELFQLNLAAGRFNLYQVGGKITGGIPLLLIIYLTLAVLSVPVIYQVYRKS